MAQRALLCRCLRDDTVQNIFSVCPVAFFPCLRTCENARVPVLSQKRGGDNNGKQGRIERVSRKDIRSCVEGSDNEEIGRVVEVFDESTATIVKVLDRDYYLVCQTGCLKEPCVHRSNTRVLNLIGKGSGLCRRPDRLSAVIPSKKDLEATERAFKRRNVSAKCKENRTDEKYVRNSLNNVSDGYCALRQTKRSGSVGYFLSTSTESSDSHSDACSVGSCSLNDRKFSNCSPVQVYCQGTELLCSDAESFRNSADKVERHSLSSPEKIAASIHSLELHAYRSTLEALYASGPLSWDQEALLTNLRISLHDEHVAELSCGHVNFILLFYIVSYVADSPK
uniref:ENT domain-containing protein n=2 Tax=Nicotiana TaxID=4085 RepID=A0A1S3XTN0_TOBAC|nr:PREDICTED: uncharacterized protein LOC104230153 [Nicotiana sylvestris]XP_016443303.1 PREDICTED: uncharacterized protein LOC107768676 [Nicotiana tabacum]